MKTVHLCMLCTLEVLFQLLVVAYVIISYISKVLYGSLHLAIGMLKN